MMFDLIKHPCKMQHQCWCTDSGHRIQLHDFDMFVYIWGFSPLTGQIRDSGSISLGSEIYKCEKN